MTMTLYMNASCVGKKHSVTRKTSSRKSKWDKPVSKAFYALLRMKAGAIAQSVAQGASFVDYVMTFIDDYLTNREAPHWTVHKAILGYFHALKDDIDKAIARCERARMRAAERKAEKMREKEEFALSTEAEARKETSEIPEKTKDGKTGSRRRQKYGNRRRINTISLLFNRLKDKYLFNRQKVPIIR